MKPFFTKRSTLLAFSGVLEFPIMSTKGIKSLTYALKKKLNSNQKERSRKKLPSCFIQQDAKNCLNKGEHP